MNNDIKISIVIPVYNVEAYLEQCLECALAQTLQDFEIILVNDGSTDGSSAICDRYAEKDSRIRVIHKENEGSGPTRTRGMLEAKGEYLAFPDSDDWFEPTMYEDLYRLAKENDADAVFSAAYSVFYDDNAKQKRQTLIPCNEVVFTTKAECRKNAMQLFPTSTVFDVPWNKLYRRQLAVDNNLEFRTLRRCQDAVFNLDFYNCCERVVSTSKAYYYYRENTQSLVWSKFPKDYIDIQIFYHQHIKALMSEWGIYSGDIQRHYDNSFAIAVRGVLDFCFNPNWNYNKAQKFDYVCDILDKEYVQSEFKQIQNTVSDEHKWLIGEALAKNYKQIFKAVCREHLTEQLKEKLLNALPGAYKLLAKIKHGVKHESV